MRGCLSESCQLLRAWGQKHGLSLAPSRCLWLVIPAGGSSRACCCGRKGALGLKVEIIVVVVILRALG